MGSVVPSIIPVALDIISGGRKEDNTKKQVAIQQQQILQQQKADEDKRQRALRAAVATRRARNAAGGIESGDGSAEAVLLGMFQQSEEEFQNRLDRDNLRLQAVNQSASNASARNLLSLTGDVVQGGFNNLFLN